MSRPLDTVMLSEAQLAELTGLLDDLTAHHTEMLALLAEHRAAIASADTAALDRCIGRQQHAALRLSELESRRARLVRSVWQGEPGRRAAGPVPAITLSFLASRAAEPARGSLLRAAVRLKELMATVAEKQRAVRSASESLLGHMQGLIAQVARTLSPTGIYARPGAPAGVPVAGGLDMTS